ncbi:hypothetical protein POM88_025251 [Heracleum sosnowskyi]|uniref:Uncharacterized protein n=1 Tax=Heracleum sosnowskyi TaxID=360622 RepID=A0AAD8I5T4_9APIA|nr:hypothetical protein POM88_025251 [Heracleum sosnowskyi]
MFYKTLVVDLCSCWTGVPVCFFNISLHSTFPVLLMLYISSKVSDIVEGDEFVCFVDFCWNQHSLVSSALLTVFYGIKSSIGHRASPLAILALSHRSTYLVRRLKRRLSQELESTAESHPMYIPKRARMGEPNQQQPNIKFTPNMTRQIFNELAKAKYYDTPYDDHGLQWDNDALWQMLITNLDTSVRDTKLNKQALLKSKCSPNGVVKVMKIIEKNEVLMRAVDDMGFKSLKYLQRVKMDFDLIKKLLDSFDLDTCSIFGVNIKAGDVARILGVPTKENLIPTSISDEEQMNFKSKFKKRYLQSLTSNLVKLKDLKEADISFKETFMLFTLGHFLCPTTSEIPYVKLYRAMSILPHPR